MQSTFAVVGMTCGHCVAAVIEEVGAIAGVTDVRVDLASGALEVTGDSPVARQSIAEAVEEAGYRLAP